MDKLNLAYEETIEGWLRALNLKNKQAGGQATRLAALTVAFATQIGIQGKDLVTLRRAALLHDIGKIGIPDTILTKAGPLTKTERVSMQSNPELGYEMLSPISFLGTVAEIVYCHYEYWNGGGYPRGLKGKNIPKLARILCVCNVWEALRSDQVYRKAWTKEDARNYIDLGAGNQFDPEIVEKFLDFIDNKKLQNNISTRKL